MDRDNADASFCSPGLNRGSNASTPPCPPAPPDPEADFLKTPACEKERDSYFEGLLLGRHSYYFGHQSLKEFFSAGWEGGGEGESDVMRAADGGRKNGKGCLLPMGERLPCSVMANLWSRVEKR